MTWMSCLFIFTIAILSLINNIFLEIEDVKKVKPFLLLAAVVAFKVARVMHEFDWWNLG
ncbi:quorum-sensing system DWW-type pheromone [Streptococcus pyogenes]|uniref:quorum-sensing system DWW-type pheromone n=2 Tax=Streptococcus pyogenes TaxID=1314 RepID=UPI001444541B|nr:quorum-sensing system DWW-type pheromone [Streptococcus pyogenes]